MNAVEVCNLALGRIGQGAKRPIQSIDRPDESEAAAACARVYQPTLDAMLAEYRWPFAQRAVALAVSADVVPGYPYVYRMPADALAVHAILPEGASPARTPWATPGYLLFGANIGTDQQAGWLHYTARTEVQFSPALFQDALAWRLAKELALILDADPRFSQNADQQYVLALSKALAQVGNETSRDPALWPDRITVRG